jgi:hypothetical protein
MLARFSAPALLALLIPTAAPAQVAVPDTVAVCADLAMEVIAKPKGRDQMSITLRVSNKGPGDFAGTRGDAWVEHVITIKGKEVERKKQGFTAIPAGGKKEFSFTRGKDDGDFGVWAVIQFSPKFVGKKGVNGDCNTSNNGAVTPVLF